MNLKLNFDGKTLLKNWWKLVRDNFITINTNFESHRSSATLDHSDKSVKNRHIDNAAVSTDQIEDYSVTQSKLSQYSVSSAKIYPEAVQTVHIKNGNVTRDKLDTELQNKLTEFQEYIDAPPSTEIVNGSVTWNKIDENVQSYIRNHMSDSETYSYCKNNFKNAYAQALFFSLSSSYGALVDAPPDNTAMENGYIRYILFVTKVTSMQRLQIATNLATMKSYYRLLSSGQSGGWKEMP